MHSCVRSREILTLPNKAELMDLLRQWADAQNQSLYSNAEMVATASLTRSVWGRMFHAALGFNKK
jgi:CRISPR-associated endonuclease/helicase Cas3